MPDLSEKSFGPVYCVEKPDFPLHPLCTVFPRASDEDVTEMCRITRQIGGILNDPIVVWHDPEAGVKMVLDGGNRQHVARLCEVHIEVRDFLGDYPAARTFVLLKNLGRRHLTSTQRVAALLELEKVDRKHDFRPANARELMAKQAGASESTVKQVERVAQKGGDEAIRRLKEGRSTLREELRGIGDVVADPTGRSAKTEHLPTPGDVVLDDDGTEVPEALLDVWRSRARFRETRASFKLCLDGLRSILREPGGGGVSVEHERHVKDLVSDLEAKMPSLICCHCDGSGVSKSELSNKRWRMFGDEKSVGKCYCCKGRGYLLKDEPRPGPEWESQRKLAS